MRIVTSILLSSWASSFILSLSILGGSGSIPPSVPGVLSRAIFPSKPKTVSGMTWRTLVT